MNKRKPVWVAPWGYAEGVCLSAGLLIVGFALQGVGGGLPAGALAWPVNLFVALGFSALLVCARLWGRTWPLVVWLGRVPASLCAMALVTLLVLVMGLVLQGEASPAAWVNRLGLNRMTSGWPFLLALFFFLATLGMATVNRLIPWRTRHAGFLLNHLGLYLAVMAGLLGAPDVERLLMELHEGEVVWQATDAAGRVVEPSLALALQRFEKEEYPPKAALVDPEDHRLSAEHQHDLFELAPHATGRMGDWQVEVLAFHALAHPVGGRYEPVLDTGAAPAAHVRAVLAVDGTVREGWITCGSFAFPHRLLELDDTVSLAMTVPRASAYRSHVLLYTPEREPQPVVIEVNRPHAVDGWKLYQHSYDDRFGRWSRVSVIELVRDPWLPVVYTGVFMLLAGAVYLLFTGRPAVPSFDQGDADAFV